MPHALAQGDKACIEPDTESHPLIEVPRCVFVTQVIRDGFSKPRSVPQAPEVAGYPFSAVMPAIRRREEVHSVRAHVITPHAFVILPHQFQHRLVKDDKMLVVPLAMPDVNYPMQQVDVLRSEKPGLRRPHAGAEEKSEENRKGDLLQPRGKCLSGSMGITPAEQVVKLIVCKVVRHILVPVPFLWEQWQLQKAQATAVQVFYAAYDDLYASTAGITLLRVTLPAPAVHHLLCQGRGFWMIVLAVSVKRGKILSVGVWIPFARCLHVGFKPHEQRCGC